MFLGIIAVTLSLPAWAQSPGITLGGRNGPPPEARQACVGKSQGDTCAFQSSRGAISGDCGVPPRLRQLVCMPQGGPRRGQRGDPQGDRQLGGGGAMGADIDAHYVGAKAVTSKIPDTQQGSCFNTTAKIPCPVEGEPLYGQDAHYSGPEHRYIDNRDGTITDAITGLKWQKAHNAERLSYYDAASVCANLNLGGKSDWRLPNIKELFSLSDYRGSQTRRFFIADVFDLEEPGKEVLQGDRFASTHATRMMGQTWSSTIYTGVHYGRPGVEAAFFYNFLDGHIKQAPTKGRNSLFYRCVRGAAWGANDFKVNSNGTVTDTATGLTWQQVDDGQTRDWPSALAYCEGLTLAGHSDWRLPNVKELQSIVDYSKNNPALDQRALNQSDKNGWFWSATTHGDNIRMASYVCFGKCTSKDGVDTHGAGAQRSDPKTGDPSRWTSLGGQEDEVRINNFTRCVR
ncbi:MAG: DUF1566 domain-containing protein [Hyphomicrobiales bacterium]|nr:DUF1566 domain-containing protein [Hyphomicrobiales bacterium]MCP5093190.1 DUF1566 domain-containing protein [Gammaproteobacteria bacterium]